MLTFRGGESGVADVPVEVQIVDQSSVNIPTALPEAEHSSCEARAVLNRVVTRLGDKAACQQGMEEFSNTLEVMTALAKSFRRRRTVDVYFDAVSERKAFKTQMTAIGCMILMYLMFGSLGYLIFEKLFTPAGWILWGLRVLLVLPIVFFLVAQMLLPLARERGNNPVEK